MLANTSVDTTHRFQPFQSRSELVEKVDQPNQPKMVSPNRTWRNSTNQTNQKQLIPVEHSLRVLLLLLEWDANSLQGYPKQYVASTHL